MLAIYRRHTKACPHKSRQYRRCSCSIWAQGTLRGESIRESLDLEAGWIDRNPIKAVGRPKLTQPPTMPFTEDAFRKLLAACDKVPKGVHSWDTPRRILAFLLLLRYSGLRRTDAVGLHRDRITDGKLFLYTQKTGVPVWIPLPDFVVEAMEEIRKGDYYFWSGNGNIKSATSAWDRTFRRVTKRAGVKGHFHMFRDTFAVSSRERGAARRRADSARTFIDQSHREALRSVGTLASGTA